MKSITIMLWLTLIVTCGCGIFVNGQRPLPSNFTSNISDHELSDEVEDYFSEPRLNPSVRFAAGERPLNVNATMRQIPTIPNFDLPLGQRSPGQYTQPHRTQTVQSGGAPGKRRKQAFSDLRRNITMEKTMWAADKQGDDPKESGRRGQSALQRLKQQKKEHNRQFKHTNGMDNVLGVRCSFETTCGWMWNSTLPDDFHLVTGSNLTDANITGMMPGPSADASDNAKGNFLHLRVSPSTGSRILRSPPYSSSLEGCTLNVYMHQSGMSASSIMVAVETTDKPQNSWIISEIVGEDTRQWQNHEFRIGKVAQEFQVLIEVLPKIRGKGRGHISIDNIQLANCFREPIYNESCSKSEVKCLSKKVPVCIGPSLICDTIQDCDQGEDEVLNCDKIPNGGNCDFETDWCGWKNSGTAMMLWERHTGPTPTDKTGPDADHTHLHKNVTGHYVFVNMNQHVNDTEKKSLAAFASNSIINSVIFNPPPPAHSNSTSPYAGSCKFRFYVNQFGLNSGSLNLSVVEIRDKENITTTLWWNTRNLGNEWHRINVTMPNITVRYYLQFEARMGMRIFSDVAIDDISLSPECFGINIPNEYLDEYNYWDYRGHTLTAPLPDFINKVKYNLSSCGARGKEGPTKEMCSIAYNNSNMVSTSRVIEDQPYKGMQVWKVPNEGYYTIIAKGAAGGLGSGGVGTSRGAVVVSVFSLLKDEELYMLIGQRGEHACIKSMGMSDKDCQKPTTSVFDDPFDSKTKLVKNIIIEDGGGGGGGGTFIFILNAANKVVPLMVAGGGGGLGIGRYFDDNLQHGQVALSGFNETGQVIGNISTTGGAGGGWRSRQEYALNSFTGAALLEGGRGGEPCYKKNGLKGQGGFGGGGGGCNTGGGGGGYAGGDTYANITNGKGGTSYLNPKRGMAFMSSLQSGDNTGSGQVIIIPAIEGCGCDYRCVALDEYMSKIACICPPNWRLKKNNLTACEPISSFIHDRYYWIIFLTVLTILLLISLAALIFMLYNRYQRTKQAALRHKMLLEQDLQLSRLRNNVDDSALTNFNPNYGCDGILNGNVDVKNLPQVARESLRLVKALGQGAFGEVYQGLYRHRDGDAVEMPVAVKTLPEMSTGQAEADFLMEAAIMAKFNHPNIVHLIGVCFDRHPRFIVLELLAGGDLKNFLREGRNKAERPSALSMKDLVFCALDVAKGCRYMESKRFIHRDIAARNCLLSSKGPGRVVKIADFGMARDIYRSDYYRKGGKAMLPIKWMPPEAFLDGIFTSKTDVWSFGVLLWEVFSLGLMPYTGLPNRDVMQLVTGGGRLDAPANCPIPIYRIMADCWNPSPEERPSFSVLLERLTACTQDPDVMNAPLPLPSIFRPATERDMTIMRPEPGTEDCFLQVPNSSDYLIPLPGIRTAAERLLTEAAGVTLSQTPSIYSAPQTTSPAMNSNRSPYRGDINDCHETSFMMDNAINEQPVMSSMEQPHNLPNGTLPMDTKLISLDTPQQTPTTIEPPISFSNPKQTITMNGTRDYQSQIMLDPVVLLKQNGGIPYANVNVSKQHDHTISNDKLTAHNNLDGKQSPYSMKGYNENHSEITC